MERIDNLGNTAYLAPIPLIHYKHIFFVELCGIDFTDPQLPLDPAFSGQRVGRSMPDSIFEADSLYVSTQLEPVPDLAVTLWFARSVRVSTVPFYDPYLT